MSYASKGNFTKTEVMLKLRVCCLTLKSLLTKHLDNGAELEEALGYLESILALAGANLSKEQ